MPYFIAFILGLIIGSFLNVCIFRLPKEESIVFPGSHCQSCKKPIAPYDNIPILSFFILKGRCRHCGTKISPQYLLVEFLAAIFCVIFYSYFGFTAKGILYLILGLALLMETFIDLAHRIIPDEITLPGIIFGLVVSTIFPGLHDKSIWWQGLLSSFIGMIVGGGFFYMIGVIIELILKKEAIGGGDIKLLAMIGALLGLSGVVWTIFMSSLLGSVYGIYARLRKGDEHIAYGPHIAAAAIFYMFFGQRIILWYIHSMAMYGA